MLLLRHSCRGSFKRGVQEIAPIVIVFEEEWEWEIEVGSLVVVSPIKLSENTMLD